MLRKRIIFTLIYADGLFTQSRNFRLQKVGNLTWLKKHYQFQKISFSIDELIILNASRTKTQKTDDDFIATVRDLTEHVFIPVAVGGGIRSMEDAKKLFENGSDKIVINSIFLKNPQLVKELIHQYGSQSIVAAVDYKKNKQKQNEVLIESGSENISHSFEEYIRYVLTFDIGELYLNSIEQDGTGFGYDFETVDHIKHMIRCPLIIAGGAGNAHHLLKGLEIDSVHAVSTANLFNFMGDSLPNARRILLDAKMNLAEWCKN